MSRQLIKGMTMLVLVVALALVSAVASAYGQSNSTAKADIPFEFVAGSRTLAAGNYQVSSATAGGEVVRIRGMETAQTAHSLTMGLMRGAPAENGKLVFRRYGNKYFLAEIWNAGETSGRELLKSKEERAVQRELASIKSKTRAERIEIALVSR
jgi:hypothetical protein